MVLRVQNVSWRKCSRTGWWEWFSKSANAVHATELHASEGSACIFHYLTVEVRGGLLLMSSEDARAGLADC